MCSSDLKEHPWVSGELAKRSGKSSYARDEWEKIEIDEEELRKAEADRHNLEVQLDELKGQLKKAMDGTDLGSEMSSMHDKVTRLEAEKSTVEAEAKSLELKATALAEQRTQSDTRNKELIDEIAQARNEIRTLQPEAASAKAARDQRGKRIKELEREVETVTKIREDSGGAGMSVERRMLHEVELTNKIKELEENLEEQTHHNLEAADDIQELEDKLKDRKSVV